MIKVPENKMINRLVFVNKNKPVTIFDDKVCFDSIIKESKELIEKPRCSGRPKVNFRKTHLPQG